MSAIRDVRRRSMLNEVIDQFVEAIATGEWKPDEKIPSERELVSMTGTSRITVRGALQHLSTLGMIESRQGDGTYVRKTSGGEFIDAILPMILSNKPNMDDMMEFRLILEPHCSKLAAMRRTPEQMKRLKALYNSHLSCTDTLDTASIDYQFHALVAVASGNTMLAQVYDVLTKVFSTSLYSIVDKMGSCNALHYHGLILDAIERQDCEAAERYMQAHILDTIVAIRPHAK